MGLHSRILLGKYETDRLLDDFIRFDVLDQNFWSIRLVDIRLGDKSLGLCPPGKNCFVTPDSGTSCLTMPSWAYNRVKSQFPEEEPCVSDKVYPSLTYVLEDENGTAREYTLKSERWISYEDDSSVSEGKKCTSIVQPLDIKQ